MSEERLLLGEIVAAHGIKGLVKVRCFTEAPADIVAYGPLHDEAGAVVELSLRGPAKDGVLAALPGVTDRNGAEALKGTKLYVARSALPDLPAEGEEYYYADLIGLRVELADGTVFGEVKAMHDFGAGDVLELAPKGPGHGARESIMIPFNRQAVLEIDLAKGRLVIAAPDDNGGDDNHGGNGDDGRR
ncbi:MAG: ribosome maturation factor RimM [Alphaproteobacteria bacterium]|jgi:16S rRNA processing protein RimM|nr:ribosome maturation factor RimM [Alphaproteobacteria bacterium]|tara:strand:+ start:1699 stop:2262 length:564 start_codon:yes stop_codon:yes gene_type:complete